MFSVIVPTFNCGAGKIERSIESILRQKSGLSELIVVDGASADTTLDAVMRYGDRVRWISEKDEGVYSAMNKGVSMARGRYLYFLGAGDTLREGVLEKIAGRVPAFRIGFVYGNVFMHDRNLVWDGPWTAGKFRTRTPCQQAIFYDRRIFEKHGCFESRFKTMADYAMNIRAFGDRTIAKIFIDEIIADYEGAGYSANFRDEAFYAARPALLKEHLGVMEKKKMTKLE